MTVLRIFDSGIFDRRIFERRIKGARWRCFEPALKRRGSVVVKIGDVWVGGNHPIVVQSMTNTDTADVASTVNQVMALAQVGSELVRVTVNTEAAAQAVLTNRRAARRSYDDRHQHHEQAP